MGQLITRDKTAFLSAANNELDALQQSTNFGRSAGPRSLQNLITSKICWD
jgi:hypothetical protein